MFQETPVATAAPVRRVNAASPPRLSFVYALLLSLPALLLGYLMYTYAVDVPFGDQWDGIGPLFEKMRAGTLGFGDFFAFHNEHRIFFPRLLIFPLAKLTHWNVRAEVGLIWVLACLCAVNIWRVATVTGFRGERSRTWLLFGAYVLLFTPMQWENVLWGFQVGFFFPLVTMTAMPWAACAVRRPANFFVTAVLCLMTTFSIASGFTSWLLAAPLLMYCGNQQKSPRESIARVIWLTTAAVSVGIYFYGYVGPDHHPNQLEALQQPVLLSQFILAYLGNPFCYGTALNTHAMAQIAGSVLLLLLIAVAIYLWRCRRDRSLIANALPWLSIAGITLFNAVLTMFGRMGYGVRGALQSRYVSFAVMLPIALLFLGALIERHWREKRPRSAKLLRTGYAVGIALFTTLFLFSTFGTLRNWPSFQHDRFTAKAVLALRDIVNEPTAIARYVHWNVPRARELAETVESVGYLRPTRLHSAHLREIARPTSGLTVGEVNAAIQTPDGGGITVGWAILPTRERAADSVLLAYETVAGDPIIFARVNVRTIRGDIEAKFDDSSYRRSGWEFTWGPNDVPKDAIRITAWAFDAEDVSAYEIGVIRP